MFVARRSIRGSTDGVRQSLSMPDAAAMLAQ